MVNLWPASRAEWRRQADEIKKDFYINFRIMFLIAALGPMKAQAWEVFQEKEDDGRVFTIAEQA